jgi:Fur family peroxide stress response transcriptional regulator
MINRDAQKSNRLQILQKLCREQGLKVTHQRLEILQAVASAENHPSADEVFRKVRTKLSTISFDTVYRNLALLEHNGVIARVQYLDDKTRYDSNLRPHHHLVCTKCKKIQDFYWPDVEHMKIPEGTGEWGTVHTKYVELRGLCLECLEAEKKKK